MLNRFLEMVEPFSLLWHHKLFTIAKIDIHFGNLVIALTLLLFASRLSRLLTKLINKRLILRFVEDKSSQNTYQTFAFYGSLACVVTLSLTIAGIPLTVFTVIGGALAIGVGFGSQNIVNNFISGVIILVEQPIKVGDVVDLDGISGSVLSIGTRSTKIKNGDNKIFIVPNSFFLEKTVLNWTYENSTVRTLIDFGVAYDSDVKLVERVCREILLNTKGIDSSPAPQVLFNDFGESNLNFELIFWADIDRISSLAELRSHVRYQMNEKFRQHKIEMAFPQRDVNLKASYPLKVEVLS